MRFQDIFCMSKLPLFLKVYIIYNSDQFKIILAMLHQLTDKIEQSQEMAKKKG